MADDTDPEAIRAQIRDAERRRAEHTQHAADALAERDDAIRAGLRIKVPADQLAQDANLKVKRVYQIRHEG